MCNDDFIPFLKTISYENCLKINVFSFNCYILYKNNAFALMTILQKLAILSTNFLRYLSHSKKLVAFPKYHILGGWFILDDPITLWYLILVIEEAI